MSDVESAMTACDPPNWRDRASYSRLIGQPPEAWAWEFLRRNEVYRAEYLRWAAGDLELASARWGLVVFCDPWA